MSGRSINSFADLKKALDAWAKWNEDAVLYDELKKGSDMSSKGMDHKQGSGSKITVSKKVSVAGLGKGNQGPSTIMKNTAKGGMGLTKNKNTRGV